MLQIVFLVNLSFVLPGADFYPPMMGGNILEVDVTATASDTLAAIWHEHLLMLADSETPIPHAINIAGRYTEIDWGFSLAKDSEDLDLLRGDLTIGELGISSGDTVYVGVIPCSGIPREITIVNGWYFLDGGSILLRGIGDDGRACAFILTMSRIADLEERQLYFYDEMIPKRGDTERQVISLLTNATIAAPESSYGVGRIMIGIGGDLVEYTSLLQRNQAEAVQWLVQRLVEFVNSEAYVAETRPAADEQGARIEATDVSDRIRSGKRIMAWIRRIMRNIFGWK